MQQFTQKSAWKGAGRLLKTAWACSINLGMCHKAEFLASAGATSGTAEALTQSSEGQMWPSKSGATGRARYLSLGWDRKRWCPCLQGVCSGWGPALSTGEGQQIVQCQRMWRLTGSSERSYRHNSSNHPTCTTEAVARDLYVFKQQMRLPRSGRLGLTGEQLCREGLGALVGSKLNMSQWLREQGLFSLEKRRLQRFWGEGKPNSSLPMPTRRLSGRWSHAFHSGAWWEVKRQQA